MNFLTQETPGKIMTLLGASIFSLALLFSISMSNQSFGRAEVALSNPFAPEKVMAVLDNASNSYSNFVTANLTWPLKRDLAILDYSWHEDLAFVMDNTADQIVAMAGLSDLVWVEPSPVAHAGFHSASGNVAGAFSVRSSP